MFIPLLPCQFYSRALCSQVQIHTSLENELIQIKSENKKIRNDPKLNRDPPKLDWNPGPSKLR